MLVLSCHTAVLSAGFTCYNSAQELNAGYGTKKAVADVAEDWVLQR